MSGPPRVLADADDPALDPGVILDRPLVEWNGWQAVRRHGGTAILPWRSDFLAATAAGVAAIPFAAGRLRAEAIDQVLVRIQKGRDATWEDLMWSWNVLAGEGRLVVTGPNELGIASWVKRLETLIDQPGEVLANHSRSRAVLFRCRGRPHGGWPGGPTQVPLWTVTAESSPPPLIDVPPGVFSQGVLDKGTALLVSRLADEVPAARVLDLGCGGGHLGLNALLRWPQAQVWFVDADARACNAATANLNSRFQALCPRTTVTWWDVGEALPATGFDLILNNPPCHSGTALDLTTARSMFRIAAAALNPGGRLLVVANRQLPYEAELAALGPLEIVSQQGGFKLLALHRGAQGF